MVSEVIFYSCGEYHYSKWNIFIRGLQHKIPYWNIRMVNKNNDILFWNYATRYTNHTADLGFILRLSARPLTTGLV